MIHNQEFKVCMNVKICDDWIWKLKDVAISDSDLGILGFGK